MKRHGPRRRPSARQHSPRACARPRRPRIRNGFLHKAWVIAAGRIRTSTPWLELRRLLDDQVPATGADRRRAVRSDLTESIVLVLFCLLARMDLRSLRVGHHGGGQPRKKHDFVGLPRATICRWSGLDERTVSRVLALLRHAGLVHGPGHDGVNVIGQPWEKPDGGGPTDWKPAIRRFDELFFSGLGLMPWLAQLRAAKAAAPQPGPGDRPAVSAKSTRDLVGGLAKAHALERPPDG